MCERGADSDGSLKGDSDGGVDRAHHRHVDQAEQERDEVGEENRLGKLSDHETETKTTRHTGLFRSRKIRFFVKPQKRS